MEARGMQHYKEQTVYTMTQGELLVLLYDELVKRLTQAELALDKQMYPLYEQSVQRGIDIINYLDETLDRGYQIGRDLARLYEYYTYELGRAKIGRNKKVLTHVKELVTGLRDSFREAEKNTASEQSQEGNDGAV